MEHVIALDWGRFPQETEAIPQEHRKRNGGAASDAGDADDGEDRRAALLRLENALARPPEAGMSLYEEDGTPPPAARPFHSARQESSAHPEPSILEQRTAQELSSAAANQGGKYINRLMWTGQAFEERMVLVVPETHIEEPQPAPILEEMAAEAVLENPIIETPLLPATSATADVAPVLELAATHEETRLETSTSLISEPSLHADAQQLTPTPESASSLASSNGSKLSQGMQGSDRSQWYVLKGVLNGAPAPEELPAASANIPVLAVFSLAGGVGKSSMVAALGRALAARGERVLLVEATPFGSLPYFFGACDSRPGMLRTFQPPVSSCDVPIRLASVDPESLLSESLGKGSLVADIQGWAEGASRVIVDIATASAATARSLLPMSPAVLVPLIPDINSVVAAHSIDSFFQNQGSARGAAPEVFYLLNQFDPSLPLHLEVAKVLREGLGERLLPFTLERDTAVSEALADGMTVIDYSPASAVTENFTRLAEWVNHFLAPAQTSSRGARWSER